MTGRAADEFLLRPIWTRCNRRKLLISSPSGVRPKFSPLYELEFLRNLGSTTTNRSHGRFDLSAIIAAQSFLI